jgi:uncharacterized membrane protein YdbT with pleckstrin-like domain
MNPTSQPQLDKNLPGLPKYEYGIIDPKEYIIAHIKKHSAGIVLIFIEFGLGIIALLSLFYTVIPDFAQNISGTGYRYLLSGIIFTVAIMIMVLYVSSYIYKQNSLIITNESVIQIGQRSLFSRKASRVSMSNVEDVSADQRGILSSMFGYGTLAIKTAGSDARSNFKFTYCPKPEYYSNLIMETRQDYEEKVEGTAN